MTALHSSIIRHMIKILKFDCRSSPAQETGKQQVRPSNLSLVHTLQKLAPEIGAINSTPVFCADCIWQEKTLAPNYGVKIINGRRLRHSSFHPMVIITPI